MTTASNQTITSIGGIKVGHYTDLNGATGCTVIILPSGGAIAGVEVRGAAPGTRETDLLKPGTLVDRVHAILLGGGSAFGLAAADGIMKYLEENGVGFQTRSGPVPIVPGAILFDLGIGDSTARPTAENGYQAAYSASDIEVGQGSIGAGTGATVSKFGGMENAIKGGLGSMATQINDGFSIGALVVVNSSGDVTNPENGKIIAGSRDTQGTFKSSLELLRASKLPGLLKENSNTTIGIIATDAPLSVEQANRLAIMAHSGIARTIVPSYGMGDGDTLFVVSTASNELTVEKANIDLTKLGALAAWSVEQSIINAINSATGLAGIPSAHEYLTN
jgi:L-aminopeptidase/D-esterase-like protein